MAQKRDGGFDTDVREPKRYCELAAAKHQQEENLEGHSVVDETVCFLLLTYELHLRTECSRYHVPVSNCLIAY